ncbi:MAG TPA: 50S ribosomal protein L17 [Acidobacteriota bacterium]|jgi:large subunit ribosomal protein L17|nr:50S ribosomal protein L17 [Acidobacteriota bacterium]
MPHQVAGRKLGRTTSHRKALFRNLVTELIDKEHIVTTLYKAKEIRPITEKMITLGKRDTLHARRQALSFIKKKAVVYKLFGDIAPRFSDRSGGYTRIIRLGFRKGDSAETALIELLGSEYKPKIEKKGKKAKTDKPTKETEEPEENSRARKALGDRRQTAGGRRQ